MNKEVMGKPKIQTFKDLEAWKQAHQCVLHVYKITRGFPKEELFGLVSQMRRCAVSITSNIAEGFSRASYREKAQFYSIALGSVTELQNQMEVSKDVGYLSEDEFLKAEAQLLTIHKIMNGLIKSTRQYAR